MACTLYTSQYRSKSNETRTCNNYSRKNKSALRKVTTEG